MLYERDFAKFIKDYLLTLIIIINDFYLWRLKITTV